MPFKKQTKMRKLRREKGESVIPKGTYCYDENGVCPYWELVAEFADEDDYQAIEPDIIREDGYCWFLEEADALLLWDQCKICGIKEEHDGTE